MIIFTDLDPQTQVTVLAGGKKWQATIPAPFPKGHKFWTRKRTDPVVIRKVLQIAAVNFAPDWVDREALLAAS